MQHCLCPASEVRSLKHPVGPGSDVSSPQVLPSPLLTVRRVVRLCCDSFAGEPKAIFAGQDDSTNETRHLLFGVIKLDTSRYCPGSSSCRLAAILCRIYSDPSEPESQAASGGVSTGVGDDLGTLRAASFLFLFLTLRAVSKTEQ